MDEDYYTCRRCKHGSVGDCDKCEASYEEVHTKNVSKTEAEAAFNDGYSAAKEGFPISYCPISLSGRGRIEWKKGWHDYTSQRNRKQ